MLKPNFVSCTASLFGLILELIQHNLVRSKSLGLTCNDRLAQEAKCEYNSYWKRFETLDVNFAICAKDVKFVLITKTSNERNGDSIEKKCGTDRFF